MSEPDDVPAYAPEQIAALFLDALRTGDVALAGQMLDAGIDREAPDPRGFPPLVIAAYAGQEAAVRGLAADAGLVHRATHPDLGGTPRALVLGTGLPAP